MNLVTIVDVGEELGGCHTLHLVVPPSLNSRLTTSASRVTSGLAILMSRQCRPERCEYLLGGWYQRTVWLRCAEIHRPVLSRRLIQRSMREAETSFANVRIKDVPQSCAVQFDAAVCDHGRIRTRKLYSHELPKTTMTYEVSGWRAVK